MQLLVFAIKFVVCKCLFYSKCTPHRRICSSGRETVPVNAVCCTRISFHKLIYSNEMSKVMKHHYED